MKTAALLLITLLTLGSYGTKAQRRSYTNDDTKEVPKVDRPIVLRENTDKITQLLRLTKQNAIATVGDDNKVVIYDYNGKVIRQIQEKSPISYVTGSPYHNNLLVMLNSGEGKLYKANNSRPVIYSNSSLFSNEENPITWLIFNKTGEKIVSVAGAQVTIWDTLGKKEKTISLPEKTSKFDISDDMRFLIGYNSDENKVSLYNQQGKNVKSFNSKGSELRYAVFLEGDNYIGISSKGAALTICDMDNKVIFTDNYYYLIGAYLAKKYLLISSRDLSIIDNNFNNKEHLKHKYYIDIIAAAITPDAERYAVSYSDKEILVYDKTGTVVASLGGHNGVANELFFSADGRHVVAATSLNGYIWDLGTVKERKTRENTEEIVQSPTTSIKIEKLSTNGASGLVTVQPGQEINISGKVTGIEKNDLLGSDFKIEISSKEAWLNKSVELSTEAGAGEFSIPFTVPSDAVSKIASFEIRIKEKNLTVLTRGAQKIKISGVSDVDVEIPVREFDQNKATNRYALIVGNENYQQVSSSLSGSEVNVAHAKNDAESFKKYAIGVLGVPEDQTYLLTDLTLANFKSQVNKIAKFAELAQGKGEIFFFYSGHGVPNPSTKKPMILPVDVAATNAELAYGIDEITATIEKGNPAKFIAFIDACFSGVGKNGDNLLGQKGTRMKPENATISGNTIVISSSSEDEPSNIFDEQKHGFFTYHLLKLLKGTEITTYKQLIESLKIQLPKSVLKHKSVNQTPSVAVSPTLGTAWEQWSITE